MDKFLTKQDQKTVLFLVVFALIGSTVLVVKNAIKPQSTATIVKKQVQFKKQQKFPLDINKATEEELINVRGIGPKLAKRIIEYRESKGFSSIEELKDVKGIGEKTFKKMKAYLKCDQKK